MKLNLGQKLLAWLVETFAPGLLAKAISSIKVDDIVAFVLPFVKRIVAKVPTGFRPQLKELLSKLSEFFGDLAEEID